MFMRVIGNVFVLGKVDDEPGVKPSTVWGVICKICHYRCFFGTTKQYWEAPNTVSV